MFASPLQPDYLSPLPEVTNLCGFSWYASLGSRPVMVTPAWQRSARDRDRSVLTAVRALAGARILAKTAQHGHRHLSEVPLVDSPGGHLP